MSSEMSLSDVDWVKTQLLSRLTVDTKDLIWNKQIRMIFMKDWSSIEHVSCKTGFKMGKLLAMYCDYLVQAKYQERKVDLIRFVDDNNYDPLAVVSEFRDFVWKKFINDFRIYDIKKEA